MSIKVVNTIKRIIGAIAIVITIGAILYGCVSDNYTIAILIILAINLLSPLLKVDTED